MPGGLMFLRLEIFGRYLEIGAIQAPPVPEEDDLEEEWVPNVVMDGRSPAPLDPDFDDEHSVPLGFHVRGGGYDEEDV